MAKKKILLVCTLGITTGILVRNMKNKAEERGIDIDVDSVALVRLTEKLDKENIDCVLISPQLEQNLNELSLLLSERNIPYGLIEKQDYENFNANVVLDKSLKLINS